MGEVLDKIWARADNALLEIENPKYQKDQLSLRPEDRELTLERILGARDLG